MLKNWDEIGARLLKSNQTKEENTKDWGSTHSINVYDNLVGENICNKEEKTAFISVEGKEVSTYSYEEVDKQAKIIVSLLEKHVSAQERILIIGPPCAATTFTILASAYLGCEHTVIMPSVSENAIKKINESFLPRVIITCNSDKSRNYGEIPIIGLRYENKKVKIKGHYPNQKKTEIKPYTYKADDSLFSLFTSGTTGSPKKITHSAYGYLLFAAYTIEYYFNFQGDSSILCGSEAGWINGHTYSIYGPLLKGGTSILIEEPSRLISMEYLTEVALKTKLTILYLPVTTIRLLKAVDLSTKIKPNQKDLIHIKALGSMGEMLAPAIEDWFSKRFSDTPLPIVNTYFQTETGGILCAKRWNDEPGIFEGEIGKIPWYLKIRNDETGQLFLTKSIPGLMINVSSADRSQEDLKNYYYDSDNAYILHDYGKIVQNTLYVSGRNDDVMKVRGIRIASGQIEAAALEDPCIVECAAIETIGRLEIPEITLFATVNDQQISRVSEHDLLKNINKLIEERIGSHVSISTLNIIEKMPKTQSGKIKRSQLRQNIIY